MVLKFRTSVGEIYVDCLYIYIKSENILEKAYKIKFTNNGDISLKGLQLIDLSIVEKDIQKIRGTMRNPKIQEILKRCIQQREIPFNISKLTGGLFVC